MVPAGLDVLEVRDHGVSVSADIVPFDILPILVFAVMVEIGCVKDAGGQVRGRRDGVEQEGERCKVSEIKVEKEIDLL